MNPIGKPIDILDSEEYPEKSVGCFLGEGVVCASHVEQAVLVCYKNR